MVKRSDKNGAMTFELSHVRHDPAHVLAPGLFRSLKRGDRKRLKLDVTYEYGNDRLEFKGPEPLGVDDMRILQGLVAMAGPDGVILKPEPESDVGEQLRLRLFDAPEVEDADQSALVVKGSYRHLAQEIGYTELDSGGAFKHIRECVERLHMVTVFIQRGGKRQGYRLLSSYASDETDGRLYVCLNPRLAQAVLGDSRFTRLEMAEIRELETDVARLIHQRLCGWIDLGKARKVSMEVLIGYLSPEEVSAAARRKRAQRVRSALEELRRVGWTIEEYSPGKFEVERPETPH